jgi:hypothetical protein
MLHGTDQSIYHIKPATRAQGWTWSFDALPSHRDPYLPPGFLPLGSDFVSCWWRTTSSYQLLATTWGSASGLFPVWTV